MRALALTAAALAAVDVVLTRSAGGPRPPLFLFVNYIDAHGPYDTQSSGSAVGSGAHASNGGGRSPEPAKRCERILIASAMSSLPSSFASSASRQVAGRDVKR